MTGYYDTAIAASPFAHWRFDGATTTQTDVVDGKELTAGASVQLGRRGLLTHDGNTCVGCGTGTTAAYLLTMAADDADFNTSSFTACCVVQPSSFAAAGTLFRKYGATYGWQCTFLITSGYASFTSRENSTNTITSASSNPLILGVPNHVAIRYNAATGVKSIHVGGLNVKSATVGYTNTSNDGALAVNGAGATASGKSAYDELGFYNTALTDQQIAVLAADVGGRSSRRFIPRKRGRR